MITLALPLFGVWYMLWLISVDNLYIFGNVINKYLGVMRIWI